VRYVALACDYDGTIATDGVVPDDVVEAIERVRDSGRRTILVTGRELEDLRRVFDRLDVFDRVVAENGAVLFDPATRDARALAEAPPPAFAEALKERGVDPLSVGHVIVATWEPNETAVLETIHEHGLELQVIFNKGAVMVLPAGVTKASGLAEALDELRLSPHNVVGVGDAENDHAFLDMCELSVAVANALPAVKERCDHVTNGARGDGVRELVDVLLESDLEELDERVPRHDITLGTKDGDPVRVRPHRTNMLVAGPSGSGKSTLVTAFLEMLQDGAYQFCLIDPEGDYEELDRAVVLGSNDRAPTVDEALDALSDARVNLVLNLLGIRLDDRPGFLQSLLPRLQELRAETGRPHWLIVDEAHHLLPSALQTSDTTLPKRAAAVVLVTVHPDAVSTAALEPVNLVLTPSKGAPETLRTFAESMGIEPPADDAVRPEDGQAVAWFLDGRPFEFAPAEPAQERRRHRRKYAQGDVEEKAFFFRGPEGQLNLKAQNLALFGQIAEGVDDETWMWHLRRGDYEVWFRDTIKDEALAAVANRAAEDPDAETSRRRILEAISERYTAPAEASP
jgi:HAD superfamily hydrolase (TIGR01484 family)